jgi:hypothetical protein
VGVPAANKLISTDKKKEFRKATSVKNTTANQNEDRSRMRSFISLKPALKLQERGAQIVILVFQLLHGLDDRRDKMAVVKRALVASVQCALAPQILTRNGCARSLRMRPPPVLR